MDVLFLFASEFCELFQQGHSMYPSDLPKKAKQCRDVEIQMDNMECWEKPNGKSEYEVFVIDKKGKNSSGMDETWTFSKNVKQKYKQLGSSFVKQPRRRGRPRKLASTSAEECKKNEIKGDQVRNEATDADSKENTMKQEVEEKAGGIPQVKAEDGVEPVPPEQPYRVSTRGRVIKPKVFGDDILSTIKQEVLGDLDYDDNTQDLNDAEEEGDRSAGYLSLDEQENINSEMQEVEYSCEKCDFKCSKLKEYNDHQKEHLHADKICSFCGWICDSSTVSDKEFEEHLKNHSGSGPYFCNFCCARFKTRTKLFLHLPKHSKNKPFVCDICHAGFKWKHALKSHMITHKKTKDYLCDICGFSTNHKTQLKAHHLIHTGDTFKCTEPGCDYQATKKTNLKFHMMTHTREKPHQCEVCGTSFSLVKNMKRHMLLHTNDRPFRCGCCSFSTTRFDKLKEHGFKQHNIGEKPAKKFRLSEYIKMQEGVEISNLEQEIIKGEVLNIGENMETIELQVAGEENGSGSTQIVNVTSSTGEAIPIAITDISYEISQFPIQFVTQEIVTDAADEQ